MRRLQTLLRGVGELRRGEASERQLLTWAQAFDQFTNEIQMASTKHAGRKTK
jgi:hypothetical protein